MFLHTVFELGSRSRDHEKQYENHRDGSSAFKSMREPFCSLRELNPRISYSARGFYSWL